LKRIIVGHESLDRSAWGDFVLNHPEGNIFYTPEYFDLCFTNNYSGVVVACLKDGEICGLLLAVIQRDFASLAGKLTARAIIMGGPLTENNDLSIGSALLESYNQTVREMVLFSQFRNLTDSTLYLKVFKDSGYEYEDHLNIIFNLGKSRESLWSEIHSTRRKQINRSSRRGVQIAVHDGIDRERLDKCYSMLKKVYGKAGLPLPSYSYFMSAVQIFAEKRLLRVFIAEYESVIIGFRMVLCYRDIIYDWYAAGDDNHLDKYPNDILPWEVISWGKEHGYGRFDFGGAGKPSKAYGVRNYKLRFGGELVNYGRFTCVHKRLLYSVVMSLFYIRQRLTMKR